MTGVTVLSRQEQVAQGLPEPWDRLAPHSVRALLTSGVPVSCARGEAVDGDLGIVCDGTLGVERYLSDGRRVLTVLFRPGDLFDLRRHERLQQGKLIALGEVWSLALDPAAWERCLARFADIGPAVVRQLEDHAGRMQDHAADLAAKTPLERLASVLFEFRRWPGADHAEQGPARVRIPIMRRDIADYVGLKPETVSRALRELHGRRLIASAPDVPDEIRLVDVPAMRLLANGGAPRRSTGRSGF